MEKCLVIYELNVSTNRRVSFRCCKMRIYYVSLKQNEMFKLTKIFLIFFDCLFFYSFKFLFADLQLWLIKQFGILKRLIGMLVRLNVWLLFFSHVYLLVVRLISANDDAKIGINTLISQYIWLFYWKVVN